MIDWALGLESSLELRVSDLCVAASGAPVQICAAP